MAEADTYKYGDIQRYLQQKMNAQEMHSFESAMMDDPFLADAIEGYKKSNEAVTGKHLSEIKKGVKGDNPLAKVVALPSHETGWWKIAAIILLIVTGAGIGYSLLDDPAAKNTVQQIAEKESKELPGRKDSIRAAEPISSQRPFANKELPGLNKSSSARVSNESKNLRTRAETRQTKQNTTMMAMADKIQEQQTSLLSAAPSSLPEGGLEARKSMRISSITQNEFKGKVTGAAREPIPFASVVIYGSNRGVTADANGFFTLEAPDSVIQVSVIAPSHAVAKAELKSGSTINTIMLQGPGDTLTTVVAATTKRDIKKNTEEKENKSRSTAEPQGGWKNFENYIKREIQGFKDSVNNTYDKDITIVFSIDEKGRPSDIQILQETDKAVTNRVVQILENGPTWKPRRAGKISLKMAF